jgi:hypothetical protein
MEFARHRRSACAARNIGTVSVYSPPELLRSLLEIACVPLIRGLVITAAAAPTRYCLHTGYASKNARSEIVTRELLPNAPVPFRASPVSLREAEGVLTLVD